MAIMKILVATGLYTPEIGGPATHIDVLEREFPKQGIDVLAHPFGKVRSYPKIVRHIVYFFGLLRRMRNVSVVYALDPVSVGLPALLASRIAGKPLVLRVAGDYAWEQAAQRFGVTMFLDEFVNHKGPQPFQVRFLQAVERYVAAGADRVIVPSEYLKHIVGKWGIKEEKVTVIYNAFSSLEVRESREEIRRMFQYDGLVLVSAGRLVPWKGYRTLIDVVAKLRRNEVVVTCVIIGDGPDHAELVAHAEEAGVAPWVRFVGRQPKETLAVAIKGADIFVLNTAYEGFSHQLLEVMALGIPIVTTDVGGNGELIQNGVSGILVPYNDVDALEAAITHIAHDAPDRIRLTAKAEERALSFTVAHMVEGVREVLTQTASRS